MRQSLNTPNIACSRLFRTVAVPALLAATLLSPLTAPADEVQGLHWHSSMKQALEVSKTTGRPLLIQFTADWCTYCHKMMRTTFVDPQVQELIAAGFVPVTVDADDNAALVTRLGLKGLPATVVVAPDLKILKKLQGYQSAAKLRSSLSELSVAAGPSSTGIPARSVSRSVSNPAAPRIGGQSAQKPTRTASVPNQGVVRPEAPASTPETAEVAFRGCCLVSLRRERQMVFGRPEFSRKYRGRTVCFASAEDLEEFEANPQKYWPVLDGASVVALKQKQHAIGNPEFGALFRDRLWLFESLADMQTFVGDPHSFLPQQ